jgi:hypothetical protein
LLVLLVACSSSTESAGPTDASPVDADASPVDASLDVATDAAFDAPETTAETGVLDCTWVSDASNCWRTFVAGVDGCLGNPVGASVRGSLATDGKSCTYPAPGRTIEFAVAPAPFGGPDRAERDFVAKVGTTTCLHYVEHAAVAGFSATSSAGTLTFTVVGSEATVQCPDGTRYRGDFVEVAKACGPAVFAGGSPDRTVAESAGTTRLQLSGMKDVVYACVAPADAGP